MVAFQISHHTNMDDVDGLPPASAPNSALSFAQKAGRPHPLAYAVRNKRDPHAFARLYAEAAERGDHRAAVRMLRCHVALLGGEDICQDRGALIKLAEEYETVGDGTRSASLRIRAGTDARGVDAEWVALYQSANLKPGASEQDIASALDKLETGTQPSRRGAVAALRAALVAHAAAPLEAQPRVPATPLEGVPAWVLDPAKVISLARRPERWNSLRQHVANGLGIALERVDAVDAKTLPDSVAETFPYIDTTEAACLLSHAKAIRQARERKAQSCLILEDDARFIPGALVKALRAFRALPDDWDVLYLGGMHLQDPIVVDAEAGLGYCTLCFSMHAYIVNGPSLDRVARLLECSTSPCDVELTQASRDGHLRCFCIMPSVATQTAGYSDIRDTEVPATYAEMRHDVDYDYENDVPVDLDS